ncbi:MAG: helix-turn-helix transcriptional regulator [Prolixibacteraceae bacterium]|nr:helix-turn-helix transcriptional regulator [Prolixibacteraceae bacterium]
MKNTLRNERAKLNITQQELAEMVKVSRQTINAIETERYIPNGELMLRLAKVLNTRVEEIFKLETV